VEKFKRSFHSRDSLHAKYSSRTGQPVVADNEWGHLQIGEYIYATPSVAISRFRIFLDQDPGIFVASGSISFKVKKFEILTVETITIFK
jgi:phosphorylase kinase alpha/beta subunit